MKRTAIIPARAGSKRLPNKNIKPLAGIPLIGWTIDAAKKSNLFDEIIISTNCELVRSFSESKGLSVPSLRPKNLCRDNTIAAEVISYHINQRDLGEVCYLQPTSPLRDNHDISKSYKIFNKMNANAVISVHNLDIPFDWIVDPNEAFGKFISRITTERSQDLKSALVLNGAIYWFKSEAFKKFGTHLITEDCYPYIMSRDKGIDIDTAEDFTLAEFFIKRRENEKPSKI